MVNKYYLLCCVQLCIICLGSCGIEEVEPFALTNPTTKLIIIEGQNIAASNGTIVVASFPEFPELTEGAGIIENKNFLLSWTTSDESLINLTLQEMNIRVWLDINRDGLCNSSDDINFLKKVEPSINEIGFYTKMTSIENNSNCTDSENN